MFLLLFTNVELSFSCSCSWLKGEPPGTRTLAATKKNLLPHIEQFEHLDAAVEMDCHQEHIIAEVWHTKRSLLMQDGILFILLLWMGAQSNQ